MDHASSRDVGSLVKPEQAENPLSAHEYHVGVTPERDMLPANLPRLREIARAAAEASGARQVILFGSVARGEARPHSDLDLLLVMDDQGFGETLFDQLEPAFRAREALSVYGFAKDLVPIRRSDFEAGRSALAQSARRDGVVLFEHPDPVPRPRPTGKTLLERFTAAFEARQGLRPTAELHPGPE